MSVGELIMSKCQMLDFVSKVLNFEALKSIFFCELILKLFVMSMKGI